MKLCIKCKQTFDDDTLNNCPKCKHNLMPYSKEKYDYYLKYKDNVSSSSSLTMKQYKNKYLNKEERMYDDIHTIKNILVFFLIINIIAFVIIFLSLL